MKIFEVAIAAVALSVATSCDAGPSANAETASAPVASATTPASETALDRLIDTELVGGNLAYFEAISGPAKRVNDWSGRSHRDYGVNGCDVSVTAEGTTIRAITFTVTPQCNPEGFGMRFAGKTLSEAEAEIGGGRWVGGCISGCGNSVLPTYSYEIAAHKLNGGVNTRIEAVDPEDGGGSDQGMDGLFAWADRMRESHGEDYVLEMAYQCDQSQEAEARAATGHLKIVSVTVSDDYEMLTCNGSQ